MDGIIVVNKEKNYTSRDIVNIISKKFHIKKVGHTGTLDPLATGVLVVCIGKATKIVELLTADDKEYETEVILGLLTDTLDITGNVIKKEEFIVDEKLLKEKLYSLEKTYEQEVPLYSSIKINGKKLYEYARNNEKVKLPKRKVSIKKMVYIDNYIEDNRMVVRFKCLVSKGTYIRSLARDLGKLLNTYGTMKSLCRIKQGKFKLEDADKLEDIQKENYKLISINEVLNYYTVIADSLLEQDICNGKILDNVYKKDIVLFVSTNNKALSIYKKYDKDNTKIKPWKQLL